MNFSLKRISFITLFLTFLIAITSVLPASTASAANKANDFYDTSPKYVEVSRTINFAKGEKDSSFPSLSYYHITYFPAGRFTGTLQLVNPSLTVINNDGSGYHYVTYRGYVQYNPYWP
ncbi:hypothetical protein [Paenibacillus woosongensis]|uniref:Uncharacterized protein n=1 Tax=Paenibacillus woosongensis TaxID=307580 RepID=A0A7X3CMP9_9BACL|nr:hypothetical protein [Paenibacillus woosongensis]MUG44190.1 hypothetical protein [Paenibacillus woosongensis]